MTRPGFAIVREGEGLDFAVSKVMGREGFWLTVGHASIRIQERDSGCVGVQIYAKGREMDEAIGTAWATLEELAAAD